MHRHRHRGLRAVRGSRPSRGVVRASHLDRPLTADEYQVGDRLEVEIIEIRPERGQLTLSRRFVAHEAMDSRALRDVRRRHRGHRRDVDRPDGRRSCSSRGSPGSCIAASSRGLRDLEPDDFVVGSHHQAKVIKIDPDRRRVSLLLQATDARSGHRAASGARRRRQPDGAGDEGRQLRSVRRPGCGPRWPRPLHGVAAAG